MEMLGTPSRFLREIPAALLREVRPRAQRRAVPAYSPRYDRCRDGRRHLRLGQRVRHASFGAGVVMDSEGSGPHARVQVNFENAGVKWLVLAFANLTPI